MSAIEFNPIAQELPDLLAQLKALREDTPVFFWEPSNIWVATRYDDVERVMSDAENFTAEGNLGALNDSYCPEARALLSSGVDWLSIPQVNGAEGETHRRLRRVIQTILAPARINQMEARVRANVNALIDSFEGDGKCEFVSQFAYPLPVNVIFDLIGFSPDEHDLKQLALWSDDTFRLWLVPLSEEDQVTCAKHAMQFQAYIRDLLNDRRASPRDDLLTDFAKELGSPDSRITEDEVIMMFPMNLIGAGHETTKAALTNAVYHMLSEPERWNDIIANPDSISDAVEESLRFDGSVFGWFRTVSKDTQLGDAHLKKGDSIIGLFAAANHDTDKFEDPGAFCPARAKNPKQLTFSTGRHFCPGAPLARMEMRIALEEMAKRLKGLRLKQPQRVPYMESLATRVITSLDLEWD